MKETESDGAIYLNRQPWKIWQQWDKHFRFDDDNRMSNKYILPIIRTWIGQFNSRNPIQCKGDKEGNQDTRPQIKR